MSVDLSVVTSGHDVADARLHREVAALQRAGLAVEVLGLGDATGGPPGVPVRAWARRGGVVRALRALRLPWTASGSVLIALDPDSALGAVARRDIGRLLRRPPVRVVADVHEDYELLLRDRAWASGPARLAGVAVARLGIWAARRADQVVVADDHLLPGLDPVVLHNLPDPAMLPGLTEPDPVPRAVYVGDLRRSRGLFTMLDAVAPTGWHLDLVGAVSPDDQAALDARLAGDAELAGRVRVHGRMPPREAWALARGAWAGLLLLDQTPAFRGAMPSKLHEYLACGLPVVATALPRVAALLEQTGAGVVVGDAAGATEVLQEWAAQPERRAAVARAAHDASAGSVADPGAFVAACRALVGGAAPEAGPHARLPGHEGSTRDGRAVTGSAGASGGPGPAAALVDAVRRRAVAAVRLLARQRHHLPGWANAVLDWVRWRMPERWVRLLTGRGSGRTESAELPDDYRWPERPATGTRLLIGPANFAGQGNAWARAVERHVPDTGAVCFALHITGGFSFPDDYTVTPAVFRRNRRWQRDQFAYITSTFTHVILEAGRTLTADLNHLDPFREAHAFEKRGLRVAMMSHGSDSRNPAHHAARFAWSPYRDPDWHEVARLQRQAESFVEHLRHFQGAVFVSTPDLLDDLPFAQWCPVVVDPDLWAGGGEVLAGGRPVVVHAPSNSRVKGTTLVDAALAPLDSAGLVEYRRPERLSAAEMPGTYKGADIVLDQFLLGSYGVAACEAMAAGRTVVGNVTPENRARVLDATGLELPIVQAGPDAIGEVVRGLVEDPDRARAAAEAGVEFARTVHSGAYSARVLGAFLREGGE